ncbi:hypothetical protein [Pleurocapsa sp. PCC 7319]|uniref:hypothetical protein n=1 Tax=Pleurocapsa sp. PCC 7319 TaxID=118161 RepID=UPI00035F989B|nr:hypothetical protein [Pleurocapsa sp. PCC 7319]
MTLSKSVLAQYMAALLAIPPESNLAKLLKFCLAAKLDDQRLGKDALEVCQMLMENPADLPYWIQDIMGSDREYSPEELAAFGEMKLNNTEEFMQTLWQELEKINLKEI